MIPTGDFTDVTLVSEDDFRDLTDMTLFSVTRRSRTDVVHSLTDWVMVSIDLTDVTLVSDDTFRRLVTWVTHDHLSSVIESNLTDVTLVSDDT